MASLINDPNGRRRIAANIPGMGRKQIRLGKIPKRDAQAIKARIEALIAAKVSGCPWADELAKWVTGLPDDLAEKLTEFGLIQMPERATLKTFIDRYLGKRTDIKPGSPDPNPNLTL